MQQRRVRLGDILDDYCPRERRITNHAVVAAIEDEVKQTRCTTCDADHEYGGQGAGAAGRSRRPRSSPARGAAFARPPVSDPEPPVVDEELIEGSIVPRDPPVVAADADVRLRSPLQNRASPSLSETSRPRVTNRTSGRCIDR